ncbi:MAG: repressor LexA, partial [Chloroflexi bacterium]|nr:repressor LexA [Chloroflexota bacterium]
MSVSSKKLSERQKNILKYIEDYVDERGYPPSIREIGDKVGISS